MKKTLYSLMLSEDVVHEVDLLAHKLGTNRSNLINQILAEYVNMVTPDQRHLFRNRTAGPSFPGTGSVLLSQQLYHVAEIQPGIQVPSHREI